MRAFGSPIVINPFDRFGEHLLLSLRAPASYRLMTWLEAGPGADLPPEGHPPRTGRWIVCGYGRFGRAVTADLRRAGLDVTVVERLPELAQAARTTASWSSRATAPSRRPRRAPHRRRRWGSSPGPTTTRRTSRSPTPHVTATRPVPHRTAQPAANALLYAAMQLDAVLVPTELVAHEAYAHLSTPLLWRFLQEMPGRGDEWAQQLLTTMVERLRRAPGRPVEGAPDDARGAGPAALAAGRRRHGGGPAALARRPRASPLEAVVLLLLRGRRSILTPTRTPCSSPTTSCSSPADRRAGGRWT
jgi:hypothetical protein